MPRNHRRNPRDQAGLFGTARNPAAWVEMSVVILLFASPVLVRVVCWATWGSEFLEYDTRVQAVEERNAFGFAVHLTSSIFSSLRWVPLLLFIMWRSGEGWAYFGLVGIKWEKDFLIGIGLFVIGAVASYIVGAVWRGTHLSLWSRLFPAPIPTDRLLLCLASSCSIGFHEELWSRAYLIPRLEKLTGATWKSVVLSAVIFGVLHLHQGFGGVVHSVITGVILGIGFCTTRRIWPVAIAHALNDFVVSTHLVAILGS